MRRPGRTSGQAPARIKKKTTPNQSPPHHRAASGTRLDRRAPQKGCTPRTAAHSPETLAPAPAPPAPTSPQRSGRACSCHITEADGRTDGRTGRQAHPTPPATAPHTQRNAAPTAVPAGGAPSRRPASSRPPHSALRRPHLQQPAAPPRSPQRFPLPPRPWRAARAPLRSAPGTGGMQEVN